MTQVVYLTLENFNKTKLFSIFGLLKWTYSLSSIDYRFASLSSRFQTNKRIILEIDNTILTFLNKQKELSFMDIRTDQT